MFSRKFAFCALFLLPFVATAALADDLPAVDDVEAATALVAEPVEAEPPAAVEEAPLPALIEPFEPFSPDKFNACSCRDTCSSDAFCAFVCNPDPGTCEVVVPQCGCRGCVCQSSS